VSAKRTVDWATVRRLRRRGYSQAAIARELGVSKDAVSWALLSPAERDGKKREALEYIRGRRRLGLHYDYDSCECGRQKDRRSPVCGTCYNDVRADESERRRIARDRILAERALVYAEALRLRATGMTLRAIAERVGVSTSSVDRWCRGAKPFYLSPTTLSSTPKPSWLLR
jgi:transcriptional regulator with XRE-family HTH domain